jgi:predicted transposase YbfD/YdcC
MGDCGALAEAVGFLSHFNDLEDPRQRGKVMYPLDEILLLSLVAMLAGAEGFTDIALFGREKLALLRRFRPFEAGTPSHDQLGALFARLDPEHFERCFVAWVAALTGAPVEAIAIDGKTRRRTYQKKGGRDPIHMVSAFAARQRLVLGQVKVADKSNEITAIPKLLDMLAIEGAIVTIDAMGCQRAIAQKIVGKKADYVLALKENQGTLCDDVTVFVKEQKGRGFRDTTVSRNETIDAGHGRIETRTTTVIHDVEWLRERHAWPGLAGVVVIDGRRELNGKIECETRLYITSSTASAECLGAVVRGHWSIENGLHWVMDMVFRDDECRIRTDHAPANVTTLRHMACNLLRRAPGKISLRARRKLAAWNDDFLSTLLEG